MAAAHVSNSLSLNGSVTSGKLSKTRGILLETMQLIEPSKSLPVPNHLLDSKIYSKLTQNDIVQARPAVLHFGGFEIGKTFKRFLHLANVSTEVQRMHIIPPQTKYFNIKYTKGDRLVPGLSLDCQVEFTPDEWRYYYDCIRIHTKDEENLVIPIHAYPVMNTDEFPSIIDFSAVPIGHMATKVFPLRCNAPIDFEFQIHYLQAHPAFMVDPMAGIIPANSEVDITVVFSPTEFSTAQMKLQLVISEFNSKPLICTVTGVSLPGLARDQFSADQEAPTETLDPRAITPVERARSRRLVNKKLSASKKQKSTLLQEIECDGIKFSKELDTPYAVAQVLNQDPGKLRMKDLREAITDKKQAEKKGGVGTSRQIKEAMFEMAVRKDIYEERQNQLRWQVKIGSDPMNNHDREEVLANREEAWTQYKKQRGDPVSTDEFSRNKTYCTFRRSVRTSSQVCEAKAIFDPYSNNMWEVRYAALRKFQQAARKVIVRRRADTNIKGLREMVSDWRKGKFATTTTSEESLFGREVVQEREKSVFEAGEQEVKNIIPDLSKIKTMTFPTYAPPDAKDDMAVDALGPVKFNPTEVKVKIKVPYFDLKVPQNYKLMGYEPHDVHQASLSYVSPGLARPLRTGAEDEVINLPALKKLKQESSDKEEVEAVNEGDLRLEEASGETPSPQEEVVPLKPPPALFQPIEYPPLHIFNPAPGVQVFLPPLPYAETDSDFHLCPLPRYTNPSVTNPHMVTQKKYLDREEVVKGIMTWKKFPSQGLTSLANTPTLTSVWVPRWNDAFSSDLLPQEVPELFEGLSEADKEIVQENDEMHDGRDAEGSQLQLTPEMVNAQFPFRNIAPPMTDDKGKKEENFPHGNKLPFTNIPMSSTGPVPREQREKELQFFLEKKYNRLGSKFREKIGTQDSLKTDPKLVLKLCS